MTDRLATSLGLPKERCCIAIGTMNQTRTTTTNYLVKATVSSRLNGFTRTLSFLTVENMTGLVPDERISRSSLKLPKNKPLADPEFDQPGEVDMLIGSGTTLSILCVGQIKLSKPSEPDLYLQNTRFGWIIGGSISPRDVPPDFNNKRCFLTNLEKIMNRFWEIEEPVFTHNTRQKENSCEEYFQKNTHRNDKGQYTVALPFDQRKEELGETRSMAEKRLTSIERKLRYNPDLQTQYNDVLREYITLGHMSKVNDEQKTPGFYLPHHAVFKESSLTTKVRVVFDGSAKSSTGISLNDTLMVGPTIQDDIFSLLVRFRTHNYVLTGDIEKMYRQFLVRKEDRNYQRILWRDSDGQIATYELNTVTFGLSPAPFLAIRCLHQLADDEAQAYPEASRVLKNDMYVDDLLTGVDTFVDALALRDEIDSLLKRGNLNLRQWASNDLNLLEGLPSSHVNMKLQSKEDNTIKTLGIHWNSEQDSIIYTVHPTPLKGRVTKRIILSDIARVFDPLGLLGPVITHAKLIMQRLWLEKLDWDDAIPLSIYTEWLNYTSQLHKINNLSFNRRIKASETQDLQLHGFCDASEKAYGACIYVRSKDSRGVITSIILCAKSRVAPVKTERISTHSVSDDPREHTLRVTIPRLELCAAQLLAKLYTTVRQATRLSPSKIVFWSDSTIALHWIKTQPHRLLPFVANRVTDIQTLTDAGDWRHVRSDDNPADLISRGQTPAEFISASIWKHGPHWLTEDESNWPSLRIPSLESMPELRKVKCLTTLLQSEILTRYSSIVKLRRIIAYCRRFRIKRTGLITCEELQEADSVILKLVQASSFADELRDLLKDKCVDEKSKLKNLNPFLDNLGIIRVGGRLRNSSASFIEKHPAILPRQHHVTGLLINHEHLSNYHGGVQATLYALRRKYWVLDGRNQVRKIIRNCMRCYRVEPQTSDCTMGDLPTVRVTETRPFVNVGVDYCGPFFIKEKKFRNRGRIKVYLAVFVCLTVKAVHFEVVSDMTAEGFIAALKRFIARRGLCQNIYSDNGTNFVGANNEMKEVKETLQSEEYNASVYKHLANQGIKWHFIPPQSPNFGGIWEAAVKSFKRHLKRVVGDELLTFEELNTFITEVEAILNSRPLTPISTDPNDLLVLTPGHFLIGTSLTSAPEIDLKDIPRDRLSSWPLIQKIRQDFWKRWHTEYLTELNTRHKWTHGTHNIKPGTLVLIKEDNQPPLRWPMGRVVETLPGADEVIRVVRVKTSKGIFTRNIRNLAPLPMDQQQQ